MNDQDQHINRSAEEKEIWAILETVADPEVPVLSVIDLGIIRNVKYFPAEFTRAGRVEIFITPTYSGCPAMDAIGFDIRLKLIERGYKKVILTSVLSPAWTTDWIGMPGKEKLRNYGIAPPGSTPIVCESRLFETLESVQCPRCNSYATKSISQFGSTPCKALYQCGDCKEPFDYFKCH